MKDMIRDFPVIGRNEFRGLTPPKMPVFQRQAISAILDNTIVTLIGKEEFLGNGNRLMMGPVRDLLTLDMSKSLYTATMQIAERYV